MQLRKNKTIKKLILFLTLIGLVEQEVRPSITLAIAETVVLLSQTEIGAEIMERAFFMLEHPEQVVETVYSAWTLYHLLAKGELQRPIDDLATTADVLAGKWAKSGNQSSPVTDAVSPTVRVPSAVQVVGDMHVDHTDKVLPPIAAVSDKQKVVFKNPDWSPAAARRARSIILDHARGISLADAMTDQKVFEQYYPQIYDHLIKAHQASIPTIFDHVNVTVEARQTPFMRRFARQQQLNLERNSATAAERVLREQLQQNPQFRQEYQQEKQRVLSLVRSLIRADANERTLAQVYLFHLYDNTLAGFDALALNEALNELKKIYVAKGAIRHTIKDRYHAQAQRIIRRLECRLTTSQSNAQIYAAKFKVRDAEFAHVIKKVMSNCERNIKYTQGLSGREQQVLAKHARTVQSVVNAYAARRTRMVGVSKVDPYYKKLSSRQRKKITRSPGELAKLNTRLLIRHRLKERLIAQLGLDAGVARAQSKHLYALIDRVMDKNAARALNERLVDYLVDHVSAKDKVHFFHGDGLCKLVDSNSVAASHLRSLGTNGISLKDKQELRYFNYFASLDLGKNKQVYAQHACDYLHKAATTYNPIVRKRHLDAAKGIYHELVKPNSDQKVLDGIVAGLRGKRATAQLLEKQKGKATPPKAESGKEQATSPGSPGGQNDPDDPDKDKKGAKQSSDFKNKLDEKCKKGYKNVRSRSNLRVHEGQQGKHIRGHNNYDPDGTRSITTHNDLQSRVNESAGTGLPIKGKPGEPGYRELVDFKEEIGFHVDEESGARTKTTFGTIHYAKDGVHVVPAHPSGWAIALEHLKKVL